MFIVVFGRENCRYCNKAKYLLREKQLGFSYLDVTANEKFFLQMNSWVTEATGAPARTVPQIFIDGGYIGGYDDLVEHFKQQEERQVEEINPSDYFGEL